jgi:hypothetical protein
MTEPTTTLNRSVLQRVLGVAVLAVGIGAAVGLVTLGLFGRRAAVAIALGVAFGVDVYGTSLVRGVARSLALVTGAFVAALCSVLAWLVIR